MKFGSQCVVVAIDAKRRSDGSGWNIYKNGGRIDVGLDAVEWAARAESLGAGEILLTSMDCDGIQGGIRYRPDESNCADCKNTGDRLGRGGKAGAFL